MEETSEKPQTKSNAASEIKFVPPEVWPEKNIKPRKKKSKFNIASILNIQKLTVFFKKMCLILWGFLVASMNDSMLLLFITVVTLLWYESNKRQSKIKAKSKALSSTKEQLLDKLEELPSWVLFPDRERAEWINDVVLQLWPNLNLYLAKIIRSKLEKVIKKKYDSFKFEEIDLGKTPPKIDGIKVYNRSTTRDSIMLDFDIFYDGDCEINFSISGHQVGRLKDFQLSAEVRIVLKPLLLKSPVVGGIQVFFLNIPEIDFELEGLSGMPGFSYVLRKQIEEKLKKKIVFPNKITKRFIKTVEATELKSLEPEGVLRIHIVEAKDLEKRDVTGKSDPYGVFTVGAQEYKTSIVKRSLNPKWDEWCEFVILDPLAQQVKFKLYDHDDLNEDDFLGSGAIDIKSVYNGANDQWTNLYGVKHGKIHLRFTWMALTADYSAVDKVLHETKLLKVEVASAILTVFVDSARNLPRVRSVKKPDPYLLLRVGNSDEQKSKVKKHTIDPVFEEGFSFLVKNPENDIFYVHVMDKQSNTRIDYFHYEIKNLIDEDMLEFSMKELPLKSGGHDSVIIVSMQLRILTNETFTNEEESSESFSDYELSRNDSVKSHVSENPPTVEPDIESKQVIPKLAMSPCKSPTLKKLHFLASKSQSVEDEKGNMGRIHVGFQYSERRQKLLVTILKIIDLPTKDSKDIHDSYVKLKLFSSTNAVRNKTKTVLENNPEFMETFEYLLSYPELTEQRLLLTVKTKKKLFSNNMIGQVLIELNKIPSNEHIYEWYDIGHEVLPE